MLEELWSKRITRKELFTLGAAIGGAALLTPPAIEHLLIPIAEQYAASAQAEHPNEQFLEENMHKLANLKLGGSFSPEQVSYLAGQDGEAKPLKTLKFIVEDLRLRDLRLGIRWSHTMFQDNKVDLSYYRPYIDYCLKSGVNLCLNVGPFKTFRWPEQHIPYFLKDNLPPKGAMITPGLEIAKKAMNYLHILSSSLISEYGTDLLNTAKTVQTDNEPFINYGELEWTMSEDLLEETSSIAKTYFPKSRFLFNTGPFVVDPVSSLLNRLAGNGIPTVYGVDYYYKIDDHTNSNNWLIQLPLVNKLDLLTLSKMFGRAIRPSGVHVSDMEVTEGQFEGWGKYVKPGNSARELRYLLLRCMNDIFGGDTQHNKLVRLWGLEAFAQKTIQGELTSDQYQIIQLMHAVNQG